MKCPQCGRRITRGVEACIGCGYALAPALRGHVDHYFDLISRFNRLSVLRESLDGELERMEEDIKRFALLVEQELIASTLGDERLLPAGVPLEHAAESKEEQEQPRPAAVTPSQPESPRGVMATSSQPMTKAEKTLAALKASQHAAASTHHEAVTKPKPAETQTPAVTSRPVADYETQAAQKNKAGSLELKVGQLWLLIGDEVSTLDHFHRVVVGAGSLGRGQCWGDCAVILAE